MVDAVGIVPGVVPIDSGIDVVQESAAGIVGQRPILVYDGHSVGVKAGRVKGVRGRQAVDSGIFLRQQARRDRVELQSTRAKCGTVGEIAVSQGLWEYRTTQGQARVDAPPFFVDEANKAIPQALSRYLFADFRVLQE